MFIMKSLGNTRRRNSCERIGGLLQNSTGTKGEGTDRAESTTPPLFFMFLPPFKTIIGTSSRARGGS